MTKYRFEPEMTKEVFVYRQGNSWICVENGCFESPFPWWVQTKKQVVKYLNEHHAPITFKVEFEK